MQKIFKHLQILKNKSHKVFLILKISILILIFILLLYFIIMFLNITDNKLTVSFINVGQGDASLITTNNKKNILYDTGKESFGIENIEKALDKSLLIKEKLDYLILSHSDSDHASKAKYFIDKHNIKNILLNNILYFKESPVMSYKDNINNVYYGQYMDFYNYKNNSTTTLSFINPQKDELYTDENEGSVGVIIKHNNFNFIMMADIGKETEYQMLQNNILNHIDKNNCKECINILKVGHHGSKTSSDDNFLKKVSPDYCVISVGKNNYGHPHQEVLKILEKNCKKIYRTDIDKTIHFEIVNNTLKIKTGK